MKHSRKVGGPQVPVAVDLAQRYHTPARASAAHIVGACVNHTQLSPA